MWGPVLEVPPPGYAFEIRRLSFWISHGFASILGSRSSFVNTRRFGLVRVRHRGPGPDYACEGWPWLWEQGASLPEVALLNQHAALHLRRVE